MDEAGKIVFITDPPNYLDPQFGGYIQQEVPVTLEDDVDWSEIKDLRVENESMEVVSWCSKADLIAEANEANYNVQRSSLPRPTADCIFHDISISAGKKLTGRLNFSIGRDHTTLFLGRHYLTKLKWIHTKYVVLWDERYKRGWLVNGTTALLHLSRAALKREQGGSSESSLLYKPGSLEEATDR
ncbi:hypothetical protein M441DRAFT_146602, partial [Trichoderma asperellum CBS 433.97]